MIAEYFETFIDKSIFSIYNESLAYSAASVYIENIVSSNQPKPADTESIKRVLSPGMDYYPTGFV